MRPFRLYRLLLRREVITMSARPIYWVLFVAYGAYVAVIVQRLITMGRGSPFVAFSLPGSWSALLRHTGFPAVCATSIVMILSVGGEYAWGTGRQAVANGLKRGHFILAKCLTMTFHAFLCLGALVTITIVLAMFDPSVSIGASYRTMDLLMAAGYILALLTGGSIAMLLAIVVRNPGSALVGLMVYATLEGIGTKVIAPVADYAPALAAFLPLATVRALQTPELYRRAFGLAEATVNRPIPVASIGTFFAAGTSYVVASLLISWWVFRHRDLS